MWCRALRQSARRRQTCQARRPVVLTNSGPLLMLTRTRQFSLCSGPWPVANRTPLAPHETTPQSLVRTGSPSRRWRRLLRTFPQPGWRPSSANLSLPPGLSVVPQHGMQISHVSTEQECGIGYDRVAPVILRALLWMVCTGSLCACTDDVALQNPKTGETAVCREILASFNPWSQRDACIVRYITQGWVTTERDPGTPLGHDPDHRTHGE